MAGTEGDSPDGSPDRRQPGDASIFSRVGRVASSNSTVLITGESGTGKETIARAIHKQGVRAAWPFISINCAATTEDFLESELFGHLKGSKSGAVEDHEGGFLAGHRGTVFLDEIGKMGKRLQAGCCAFSRTGRFARSARARPRRSTCAWSLRPAPT